MVLGGSGVTVASNSLVQCFLNISVYPLALAMLSVDILFTEEIRQLGATWRGRLKLFQTLRFFYNVFMVAPVVIMVISAMFGTMAMFAEKIIWMALEVVTLRLLSFTSVSRGTQELLEFLSFIVPYFPTKEIQLRVNISNGDIASSGYRQPYIERGSWSSFFVIQFEFPDPKLRDEAVSILGFNATTCVWPVNYSIYERRVLVLSPLGWVENLNIVRVLKLYTDEHSTLTVKSHSIKSRWHDTRSNSVRQLALVVERTKRSETNQAFVTWMTGHRCVSVLTIGIRDAILQLLPNVFKDLQLLPDMARSRMGEVYISGVALCKLLLSTAVTVASVT